MYYGTAYMVGCSCTNLSKTSYIRTYPTSSPRYPSTPDIHLGTTVYPFPSSPSLSSAPHLFSCYLRLPNPGGHRWIPVQTCSRKDPASSVLAYSARHQYTYVCQEGGTRPTGMLSSSICKYIVVGIILFRRRVE